MGVVYDAAGAPHAAAFSGAGTSLPAVWTTAGVPIVFDDTPVPLCGAVTRGTGYGGCTVYEIAADGLEAGTYTLKYEDALGVPLEDEREVCVYVVS